MKTPLHSIMAEIEHLKSIIDQAVDVFDGSAAMDRDGGGMGAAGTSAKDVAAASFQSLSNIKKLATTSSESFESLDTTCKVRLGLSEHNAVFAP